MIKWKPDMRIKMRIGIRIGRKPVERSFEQKTNAVIKAVLDIAEMEKARAGLVQKEVEVHRGGKTFKQRRWVRPGDVGEGRSKKPVTGKRLGIRKLGQGENGNGSGFAGSVAQGDTITGKDAYTGQSITGKVTKKGKDGVTIETGNGIIHRIEWDGVEKVNKVVNDHDAIRMLYDK